MKFIVPLLLLALSGCAAMNAATQPTAEQIKAADYAAKPDPKIFTPAIKLWAMDNLKDPESLQLREVGQDSKEGWLSVCVEPGIPPYSDCVKRMFYFGHIVTAKLNAKNSSGGYTGYKDYTFLFRGDRITRYTSAP